MPKSDNFNTKRKLWKNNAIIINVYKSPYLLFTKTKTKYHVNTFGCFFVDIDILGKRRYNYRKESWSLLKIILLTCYYKLIWKICSKEFIYNKIGEKNIMYLNIIK